MVDDPFEDGEHPDMPLTLVMRLKRRMLESLGLGGDSVRRDGREAAKAGVVSCAARAGLVGKGVSYSRTKTTYAAKARYFGSSYTYSNILAGVAWGVEQGLLTDDEHGVYDERGRQSVMRATPLLLSRWEQVEFEHNIHIRSSIRVKNDGVLIDFRATAEMDDMARRLRPLNDAFRSQVLTIDHPDVEVLPGAWIVTNPKTGRKQTVPMLKGTEVYRSFTRNSLKAGGRLYGVDGWQSLPKRIRRYMLLNGEVLLEADYASLHPSMLYQMSGTVCDGDVYETDVHERDYGKKALAAVLNAKPGQAVGAMIMRHGLPRRTAEELVRAIEKRNEPIRAYFGSDIGVSLQLLDSEMMMRTLTTCVREGIPVVPVHDSAHVHARHIGRLQEVMEKSYSEVMKTDRLCPVTITWPDEKAVETPPLEPQDSALPGSAKNVGVTGVYSGYDRQVPPPSAPLPLPPCPSPLPSKKARKPAKERSPTPAIKLKPLPPAVRAGLPAIISYVVDSRGELIISLGSCQRGYVPPPPFSVGVLVGSPGCAGPCQIVSYAVRHGCLVLTMKDGRIANAGPVVDPEALAAARTVRTRAFRDPDMTRDERREAADWLWANKVSRMI